MTTETMADQHPIAESSRRRSLAGPVSAAAGVTGSALIFLLGNPLSSTTGAGITNDLISNDMKMHAVAWVAALACAGLILASARLSRSAGGTTGRVIAASGASVAVLMLAYYASFAAGSVVATNGVTDPGPGLGEATLVVLNAFSLTMAGPALALLVAAAASPHLPRASRVTGAIVAVLLVVPFTYWIANLIIPLWLGLVAVRAPGRR
jgi:hypothetical protein